MKQLRHMGVSLLLIGILLVATGTVLAQSKLSLHSFTAQYQLKRGNMIIGKVTTTLQLKQDGSYNYKSVTVPVGIVAAFRKDEITEQSQGQILGHKVIPSSYYFRHKRKKRPKLRELHFNWGSKRVTTPGTKPEWGSAITQGTQDKASKVLAMMLSMRPKTTKLNFKVVAKKKLKNYQISREREEKIAAANNNYHTIKLNESKAGQPASTSYWLAPKLNYLPIKIERKEKKNTFTMTLVKFSLR